MAFDFGDIFKTALQAGLNAAKPGGKLAEDWVRESAQANKKTLEAIVVGVATRQISKETGAMLLEESKRALESEAAALKAILKASAQAGLNAFFKSLTDALSAALKIAL
ncbi:hypothetical protein [Hydrogenophaga sp.]|jgi:hypothetical protein|uniref:hypothetical protein n=1 Tax=Hydrogenophaga sp. TaxID=1904254 RepID=UPI003F6FD5DD